jgi:Fe-S-cluster containining protein
LKWIFFRNSDFPAAFRARHTMTLETRDLQLPVVALKMEETEGRPCPFVGPEGCTVYEARPWACRMYPVGLAVPPAHAGEEPEPLYFLFEDGFCEGHRDGPTWTVARWREDQGVPERERLETEFRSVVRHPWFIGGRRLDPRRQELFLMACYDLDRFREFVFESSFLRRFVVEPDLASRLATDDTALLEFSFRWVRFALFAEPTLKVRKVTD